MRRLLLILVLICPAFAQISGHDIWFVIVDPAGACLNGQAMQYNYLNGNFWGCKNSVWTQVSGGGGSGTVTSVSFPTIPSWLTASVATPTTTPAISVTATTGQTSHQVIGTCGSATSFAPCALVAADLPAGTGTVTSVATTGPVSGGTITTTGTISCPTCATTTNGGALSATSPVTISAAGVIACSTCSTTTGTVTSVATTSPITGGTITTSGTIACATCATTTNGGALSGTSPIAVSAAGAISCSTCIVSGANTYLPTPIGTSVFSGTRFIGWKASSAAALTEFGSGDHFAASGTAARVAATNTVPFDNTSFTSGTGANATAGESGDVTWRRNTTNPNGLYMAIPFNIASSTNVDRVIVGFCSGSGATCSASTTPNSLDYWMLEWEQGVNSGNWQCISNNNTSSPNTVLTNTAVDTNWHLLEIFFDTADTHGKVNVDGSNICDTQNSLPTSGTFMRVVFIINNKATGAGQVISAGPGIVKGGSN